MRHAGIPVGVHVLLERDGRVLLMRRAGTGFFDGLYSLPGGHVEEGESLRPTVAESMATKKATPRSAVSLPCIGDITWMLKS